MVRELLFLRRVHVHLVGARVLADDHSLVDLDAGADQHRAPLLQVHQRVGGRHPAPVGHQAAGRARTQLAEPRSPTVEHVVQHSGAARLRHELGTEADETARRNPKVDAHPTGTVVDHLLHAALAQGEELRHDAEIVLGNVDGEQLDRLVALAVDLANDDLRLADGELEPLAPHRLDEDRQLELTATLHFPRVGPLGRQDPERHVADELLLQPVLDLARRELPAVLAGEYRGVDADRHREARLVDDERRQGPRIVRVGKRLTDRDLGNAGDRDDVTRSSVVGRNSIERVGQIQLDDLHALDRSVDATPRDLLALAHASVAHAAQREASEVGRRVEVGDERLERVPRVVLGRRDALENQLAQRLEVTALGIGVERRPAGACVRVDDRELDLVLVGAEIEEELVHLVDDLCDARIGAVDLVDDKDHRQSRFERLAQHEAGLRERTFARVDQEEHPVDHRERPLDLAAEIGVAGGVDDVERHVAVAHRRVLGEDRDALLALQVVRVHDPLVDVLIGAKRARLPQERVDERRLAVVDVGNDRHIAQVVARGHENSSTGGCPV